MIERDAAWWGRQVDSHIGEIQARYGVPDETVNQLMRAMIIAGRLECEERAKAATAGPRPWWRRLIGASA